MKIDGAPREGEPGRRTPSARALAELLRAAREVGTGDRSWTQPFDVVGAAAVQAGSADGEGGPVVDAAEKLSDDQERRRDGDDPQAARGAVRSGPGVVSKQGFDVPHASRCALSMRARRPVAPAPASQEPDPVPTAVREAKARLAASAPRRGPGRLAIGGGVLVVGVLEHRTV